MVACVAALILVWLGWSLWQPAATERGDPLGLSAFGAFALALLLLSVALVIFATLFVRASTEQHHLAEQLRDSRDALRRFDELLDVWQWQSDSAHRLVAVRAPNASADAGAIAWSTGRTAPLVWEHLIADDPAALRATLERGLPLADTTVRHHAGAVPARARLRGRPVFDRQGAFAGYQGTLRELSNQPAVAPAAAITMLAPSEPIAAPASAAPTPSSESDSFSYTVSHDLRAPIRVVEGFTKIVKEDYGRLLDRVGNDHLDRVLGAAARMNNMIDALLSLSKLSSQPLVRQGVNLSQLAAYVTDDLRRHSPGRQVGVEIETDMQIEGDPTLLRVVVENLLGNAWKYTGKCEQAQIWFERGPGADSFVIRDNGAGFDMRFADRLFGVFQRLHSANDFPGTGIGLASVRRIVRRHGGDIWGEAALNHGARFHFTLPQGVQRN
jgi:signal transduction histidine kinase